jgi:hypothetical protein
MMEEVSVLYPNLLPPNSLQYIRAEYLLQLALFSPSAKIVKAWSVQNPKVALEFERKTQVGYS